MSVEIIGLENIEERLEKLLSQNNFTQQLTTACALVERSAKQKAPVDTGELRRSITSEVSENTGKVFTPLEYAPYVEYGTGLFAENGGRSNVPWSYKDEKGQWHTTSGQRPQPFMRPALEENRQKIVQIFKEGLLNG